MSVFFISVIICSGMQSNEIQNKILHCTVSKPNPKMVATETESILQTNIFIELTSGLLQTLQYKSTCPKFPRLVK